MNDEPLPTELNGGNGNARRCPQMPAGSGHGAKLPRKQQQAVAALLAHGTVKQAAVAVGVDEKTLWRWMQTDTFRRTHNAAARALMEETLRMLQVAATAAVEKLISLLKTSKSEMVQVAAARTLLVERRKHVELQEIKALVERMNNVERMINKSKQLWR